MDIINASREAWQEIESAATSRTEEVSGKRVDPAQTTRIIYMKLKAVEDHYQASISDLNNQLISTQAHLAGVVADRDALSIENSNLRSTLAQFEAKLTTKNQKFNMIKALAEEGVSE